jgi:hypothetical protein
VQGDISAFAQAIQPQVDEPKVSYNEHKDKGINLYSRNRIVICKFLEKDS